MCVGGGGACTCVYSYMCFHECPQKPEESDPRCEPPNIGVRMELRSRVVCTPKHRVISLVYKIIVFKFKFYFMCMCVCLHSCLCAMCVPDVPETRVGSYPRNWSYRGF